MTACGRAVTASRWNPGSALTRSTAAVSPAARGTPSIRECRIASASCPGVILTLGLLAASLMAAGGCSRMRQNDNSEGVRLYQQGNYLGAVNHFQQALAKQPGDPDCFYNLGATYHQQAKVFGQPADLATAEQYYHLCLARAPGHEACRRAMSVLLVEEGREPEAIAGLQEWSRLQPGNPNPHIEMARLWEERGDLREAENQLVDALAVAPSDPRALVALAHLRERSGDTAQALANYQRALQADPVQPVVATRVATLSGAPAVRSAALPPPGAATPVGGQWTAAAPAR